MLRVLSLLSFLALASACSARESQQHAKEPVAGSPAANATPKAKPNPHREEDAAALKATYTSTEDHAVLFTRVRESTLKAGSWRLETNHEGWGTTDIYCSDACAKPGVSSRHFTYGIHGAHVFASEPVRTGHFGMDVNFGPQQFWIRFGRRAPRGALEVELNVGFYYFVVPNGTDEVELREIDPSEHFAELTASPESFRDAVSAKLDVLAARVRTDLANGGVELITSPGHVPITRPFDAREQAEIVANAERDIARQKALVAQHLRELHALVSSLVTR